MGTTTPIPRQVFSLAGRGERGHDAAQLWPGSPTGTAFAPLARTLGSAGTELALPSAMKRLMLLFVVAAGCVGSACGSGKASTPELCRQACDQWAACTGSPGYYPVDQCTADCEAEGDWDSTYVECLQKYSTCQDLENNCG